MGYPKYTIDSRLLHASFSRGGKPWLSRTPLIYALLISFVFSTLLSAASRSVAAQATDTTSHHTMGPDDMPGLHDMTGHDMTGHDMAGSHDKTGEEPCDHGHDCKCDDRLMSHCCAHVAPVAAILTTLADSPRLHPERCSDVRTAYSHSEDINPPTPPPRSVL